MEVKTMRKHVAIFIVAALLLPVAAFAGNYPDLSNVVLEAGRGVSGTDPVTYIRPVRFGLSGLSTAGLSSGDVVAWDTNSGDGVTVIEMSASSINTNYAGVLVTALATDDDGAIEPKGADNWGYMATKGWCLASVDSTLSAGESLSTSATYNGAFTVSSTTSDDPAILLQGSTGGSLAPVMLK